MARLVQQIKTTLRPQRPVTRHKDEQPAENSHLGRHYWIKELRQRGMDLVKQAEAAYTAMVAAWKDRPP